MNNKGVAAPLEFTVAFGVIIVVFLLVFAATAHLFVQYEVKEYDFRAKALDISERLMKDVGKCKDGSSDWEYQPDNLTYLGLAMPVVLYDAWLTDQGFVPVVGNDNDTNRTKELVVNAGGPYYGYINEPIAPDGAYVSGGVPPYSYHWVVDTSNLSSIDPPDGKAASVTVVYSQIGTYSASLFVTDSSGVTKSDSTTINVGRRLSPTSNCLTTKSNCKPIATGKAYSTSGSSSCAVAVKFGVDKNVIPATADNCNDNGGGGGQRSAPNQQATSDPCCNGPRPVPTLTQACNSACTTKEYGCGEPTDRSSGDPDCQPTANPYCGTCYMSPCIQDATTPYGGGTPVNPNRGGLAPKKYDTTVAGGTPVSIGESPLFSYNLNNYVSKQRIIITSHYIEEKEQMVVTTNFDNEKNNNIRDSKDGLLFANSGSPARTILRRTILQNGGTNVIAYQKIVKEGSQSYVTRTWTIISNLADYGLLSPEKIKAINKLDYNKVKKTLGLEPGYDFNIRITSENGTELLRYGKAFDTARDVVSFSRTVLIYPGYDSANPVYIRARLTVYVFR